MLAKLKLHIQTELGMHAAAGILHTLLSCNLSHHFCTAASPLGWRVVGFMEKHPERDKDTHGMDIDDLRAKEKQLMQHKSTCFSPVSVWLSWCNFPYFESSSIQGS